MEKKYFVLNSGAPIWFGDKLADFGKLFEGQEIFEIDGANNPIPEGLIGAFWDFEKKMWVSETNELYINQIRINQISYEKIEIKKNIKKKAEEKILEIAPMYKQINWHHDNKTSEPEVQEKIAEINRIRQRSNELEIELGGLETLEEVETFKSEVDNGNKFLPQE